MNHQFDGCRPPSEPDGEDIFPGQGRALCPSLARNYVFTGPLAVQAAGEDSAVFQVKYPNQERFG